MLDNIICHHCPSHACSGCLVSSTQPTLITTGLSELDRASLNRSLIKHNFADSFWRVGALRLSSPSNLPTASLPESLTSKFSRSVDFGTGITLSKF